MAQEQVSKIKKKLWYPIVAPKQFENTVIGETLVYDPQAMVGKSLSVSLMALTNDMKKQNINMHFKVVNVEDSRAMTTITGYEIVPSSVKRLVRRNSIKMDMSFPCETADNVQMRVKTLLITRADVKGSIAAKIRNFAVQHLIKTIKKLTYNDFLNELITHKIQSEMRAIITKIYPLKVCEIRYAGIEERERKNEGQAVAQEVQEQPQESSEQKESVEESKDAEESNEAAEEEPAESAE